MHIRHTSMTCQNALVFNYVPGDDKVDALFYY